MTAPAPRPGHHPNNQAPTMLEPANLLLEFVVGLLIPFLPTDQPALARRAAEETIAAYKAQGPDQLVTVGRLVTFALAALDTLRLSTPPDLSLTLKLKLRRNAGTLNLASERANATLERQRQATPQRDATETRAALAQARHEVRQAHAEPTASPPSPQDLTWATAMSQVAAEFTAELPTLPQPRRDAHLARIAALSTVSDALTNGQAPPRKARLLTSTALGRVK
jgi:hypothetical protein